MKNQSLYYLTYGLGITFFLITAGILILFVSFMFSEDIYKKIGELTGTGEYLPMVMFILMFLFLFLGIGFSIGSEKYA